MKIIAGLGNPTAKYEGTRHNVGFMAIDKIAEKYGISVDTKKHRALVGKGVIAGQKVILAKPQTFMNLSGDSIQQIAAYYKVEPEDILILFDDISLDVGRIRIRKKGSAGGHNGIKSIIACLNSSDFPRVKIGVGDKKPGQDLAAHVLGNIPKAEKELMDDALLRVQEAVELIVAGDIEQAMNLYNTKAQKNA